MGQCEHNVESPALNGMGQDHVSLFLEDWELARVAFCHIALVMLCQGMRPGTFVLPESTARKAFLSAGAVTAERDVREVVKGSEVSQAVALFPSSEELVRLRWFEQFEHFVPSSE